MTDSTHFAEKPVDAMLRQTKCRYGNMLLFSTDTVLCRSLVEYGEWAQGEIELLLDLIKPGDTVVDVGAFIGTHTLAFAASLKGKGRVYAVEPHPIYFQILERNLKLNDIRNAEPLNIGLSDHAGGMGIPHIAFENNPNLGHTTLEEFHEGSRQYHVAIATLDQLPFTACNMLKIDAEGMEYQILLGAGQLLSKMHPIVYAECNSVEAGWPVIQLMKNHGYESYLYNVAAYNPNNFQNNPQNIFAEAREVGLLFIPPHNRDSIHQIAKNHKILTAINTLDDLVLGMLKKPQYKHEVLTEIAAASDLGREFWLNEPEKNALETIAQERFGEIQRISSSLSNVERLADEQAKQIEELVAELTRWRDQYRAIIASSSWRYTKPLRAVKRIINQLMVFLKFG